MMCKYLWLVLLLQNCYSNTIEPTFIFTSKGFVNDFVIDGSSLYVANDEGSVEIFDLATQKLNDEIFIEPILTAQQTWQNAKILSVDRFENKTLIVSNDKGPYRNVWLYDGKKLQHIIKPADKIAIQEARFISNERFLFGTLGYEISVYDTSDSFKTYSIQPEQSAFSDLVLSQDKKTVVTASESGQVILSDTKTGKELTKFPPLNLDKVFQVAYENGTVITAGQDRKVAVFPKERDAYILKSDFLVYSVGLSPDGIIGAYSSNSNHHLQLFNTQTKKPIATLKGHYGVPTKIVFYDDKSLFSAGYENRIFYWRVDQ